MADTVKFNSVRRWNGSEYITWKMVDVCGRRKNLKADERLILARRVMTVIRKACFRCGDVRHLVRNCPRHRNCNRNKKHIMIRDQEPVLMISEANVVRSEWYLNSRATSHACRDADYFVKITRS